MRIFLRCRDIFPTWHINQPQDFDRQVARIDWKVHFCECEELFIMVLLLGRMLDFFFQRTAFFFEKSPFNEKSLFIRKISRSHFFWAHKRHKNQEEPFSRKLLELGDHLWQAKMANVSELLRKFPFFHGKLLAWQSIAFGDAHDLPKIIPFSAEKLTNSIFGPKLDPDTGSRVVSIVK